MTDATNAHRRTFLQTTAAGSLAALSLAKSTHAAENDLLKIGLVGCGGRGSKAAIQAMRADQNVKLWAMADAFEDRLQASLKSLQRMRMSPPRSTSRPSGSSSASTPTSR